MQLTLKIANFYFAVHEMGIKKSLATNAVNKGFSQQIGIYLGALRQPQQMG